MEIKCWQLVNDNGHWDVALTVYLCYQPVKDKRVK